MDIIQALLLGLVQGLTEFFPISSSAHLRIAKQFLEISDGEHLLYFDLICHAGTLIALLYFLRKDVLSILRNGKKIALFALALAPLVPAYFLLKPLRIAASHPSYLSLSLLITSFFLFLSSTKTLLNSPSQQKPKHVLCIGMAQAIALIPGISRSGSTMAAARLCGWEWKEAARFSFLLAIPAILGGEVLETFKLYRGHSEAIHAIDPLCYAAGFFMSLITGFFTVRLAFSLYEKGIIRPFAWYCLLLGAGRMVFNG